MSHQEAGDMKEGYDGAILRRLFGYAKKYMVWIAISLFLLLGVVGVELLRPVLLGRAVDDMISKYDTPYTVVEEETSGSIELHGIYVKEDKDLSIEGKRGRILYDESYDKSYFFISGLSDKELEDAEKIRGIEEEQGSYYVTLGDEKRSVIQLEKEDIRQLRIRQIEGLLRITLLFVAVLLVGLFLGYFQKMLLHYTGQKIIYNIRTQVFSHIENLSIQFFNTNPVGKLVTRVTNDTETLNEMYTSVIVNSVRNALMLMGITTMMFLLEWRLTLAVFAVIPFVIGASLLFRHFSKKYYREVRTKIAAINTFLSEHISGMKIVQIFTREEQKLEEFKKENNKLKKANIKQLVVFGIYRPTMYLLYIVGLSIILGYGGYMVIHGQMSIGKLLIFIQYISSFFDPIQQLAEQFNILQSAMASAEKIFAILDEEAIIPNKEDAKILEQVKGEIEFKNVWFAYDKEEWVLKDVSFKVKSGETVAFVGATGAGKTSILSLINRYFDIQKGNIYIDGVDIRDIDLRCLRRHMGQMLQDVFLFTGNIKSNIALQNEDITDEQIVKSAKYVNADKFISKLPEGYDEKVYERGATFSAGQRQLLSFARTLAFDPSILILDEATANIDTETELLIQDALYKLMEGRTTLVVAHRLSTIQHADRIVVLHKGRIKETGNHQELLAKKGIYHNLYKLQYQEMAN